jgi:hypothetical protein
MKRYLFCTAIVIALVKGEGLSQNLELNCTQKLRTARATYEQGRLHEMPVLLEGCLKNGFTETERVEAYRLLVLTYIYLEEPEKADAAMVSLLGTDHFFEINEAVDPVEFKSLYKKFRTKPVFSYGMKIGINTNQVNVQENHYIWASSKGKGTYKSKVGIQGGLLFEKTLKDHLIFNPEIFYFGSSFVYSNPGISSVDEVAQNDRAEFTITQTRINANFLVQYKFTKGKLDKTLSPYIALGPSVGYLMNASFGGELIAGNQFTIPDISTKENYKALTYSIIAAAGLKYKVGAFYLTADVRYQRGLVNIVKKDNRYKATATNEQLWNYGYVDNDFTLNQSMINIGLIVPYFNPKKLIK